MAISYGFYNSIDEDRLYDAIDFSLIFDGIINDGIFQNIGDAFQVLASSGMFISVGSGRAWLEGTWTYNDTSEILEVNASEVLFNRIDTVVIEVDKRQAHRMNSLKIISGIPAASPTPPTLESGSEVFQFPLADIYVSANVSSIYQSNITNRRGTTDLPFVTGILETVDVSSLLVQWQNEFDTWMSTKDASFNSLYSSKNTLLTNLYNTANANLNSLYYAKNELLTNLYNTWADKFQDLYDDFVLQVNPSSTYKAKAGAIWLSTT